MIMYALKIINSYEDAMDNWIRNTIRLGVMTDEPGYYE